MTKQEYQLYLKSKHWLTVKAIVYSKTKSCRCCGSRRSLNIHHLTYENLWHENIKLDLMVLCKVCHSNYHKGKILKKDLSWRDKKVKIKRPVTLEDLYFGFLEARKFKNPKIVTQLLDRFDKNTLFGVQHKRYGVIKNKIDSLIKRISREDESTFATIKKTCG